MKNLTVIFDGTGVGMQGPKMHERLRIEGEYPKSDFAKLLFASFGLMHLIAPYLPRRITTNFSVPEPVKKLIGAMYTSENQNLPLFNKPSDLILPSWREIEVPPLNSKQKKVAIAYSAGKDSMWNLWRAEEKYGRENVLVAHIRNLNKNNGSRELKYTLQQKKALGFRYLKVIKLLNGSRNTGYQTMRSRDIFLMATIIPVALDFGASEIVTEGFAETKAAEPFSGREKNMRYFNRILEELRIPLRISWFNKNEMAIIQDLFNHRSNWMPHVCNCFTVPCFQEFQRRAFKKRSPTFPLYQSQCGNCAKCRITNIARILYDREMHFVKTEDIRAFLLNTRQWLRRYAQTLQIQVMVEGSFLRNYVKACRKYGVNPPVV